MPLPRLRLDLDFLPSPVEDRPGLLIRDPSGYSDVTLIVPPVLVPALACFDGEQTEADLRAVLVRQTGELQISPLVDNLTSTLHNAGFLLDDRFLELKDAQESAFAAAPVREAIHAGTAYPDNPAELRTTLGAYLPAVIPASNKRVRGIAAPHVSPFGGPECYGAAYAALQDGLGRGGEDQTFIVLGTSHYGEPERFGLTRKPFATPFGETRTAGGLIDELERHAASAINMEDYCHAIEHSIEFQVVFLQLLFGPSVRVLPILCGSFFRSLQEGGLPEDTPEVARFFGTLGDIAAREGDKLTWVLGVDMAHIGQRYGDDLAAERHTGHMELVAARDQMRIEAINAGDARAYWSHVQPNGDDLRWCGSAPFYTYLNVQPQVRGELLQYDQWNIDAESVVSFGALRFS